MDEPRLAEVGGGGRPIVEGLMGSLVIVEREVAAQAATSFAGCGVFGEINLLVLYAAPQALGENVVAASATAIHADLHASAQQQLGVLRAGEMAPLVAVPNLRFGLSQGGAGASQDKGQFERVGQLPGNHIAAEPIQHGHQVHPAVQQPKVGNVDAENVVGVAGGDMPQKIGENPVFGGRFAGVGPRDDAGDAHLAHLALHPLAVEPQDRRDLARAVERVGRVQLVDAALEGQFFRAGQHGLVIQAGAVEAEQVALGGQAQVGLFPFQQRQALSAGQVRGQIFF